MKKSILALVAASLFLFSCGNGDNGANGDVVEITIEGDDNMQFNMNEIEVEAGQTVRLTLEHTGQMPVENMGHNWVLLDEGTDNSAFESAAMNAADNEYIPEDMYDDIIAYTDLIGGGETSTVEFEAPSPGTYDFLCSFPGHPGPMSGEFIVN